MLPSRVCRFEQLSEEEQRLTGERGTLVIRLICYVEVILFGILCLCLLIYSPCLRSLVRSVSLSPLPFC